MMLGVGHLNAYVNRLYYACFYAASALLVTRGIKAKRHSHVQAALNREFVKTGAIPRELGSHYNRLFESRLEGDYGEFVRFERDEVAGWLEPTRAFVGRHPGGIGRRWVGSCLEARHVPFSGSLTGRLLAQLLPVTYRS